MYLTAEFCGASRDANMLQQEVQLLTAYLDNEEGGPNPCIEDEEFFDSRPDAEDMEEAISKFMPPCLAWSHKKAVASRTCTYCLDSCLCHLPKKVKE